MRGAVTIDAPRSCFRRLAAFCSQAVLFLSFAANAAPTLVRHAGGEIRGVQYSNSLEAISTSIEMGATLIEIDLVPTKEGVWYCLHDYKEIWPDKAWRARIDQILHWWYAKSPPWFYPGAWSLPSSADLGKYLGEKDSRSHLRHCLLADLTRIADAEKRQVTFITDTKYDNLSLLATLARLNKKHFAPQVYNLREYREARSLGFSRIIFTLYKHGDYEQLRSILNDKQLWKIVFPAPWLCSSSRARPPAWLNTFHGELLVHTVNDPRSLCPSPIRIDGYYTDVLVPEHSTFSSNNAK